MNNFGQISPQQQEREARLNALEQEMAARKNTMYNPYNYQGFPQQPQNQPYMQNPQDMYQQPQNQQNPQQPVEQPIPTKTPEPQNQTQSQNEYLQGYPIEGMDQLREARVGLDGRVSIFPFLSEESIYTKQTNLDGLPEYKRFVLDESFQMEDLSNISSDNANLTPVIEELKTLQAEIRSELKALREERKNVSAKSDDSTDTSATESVSADNSAVNDKRNKPNAASSTATKSKPRDATNSSDSSSDAKG